MSDNMPRCDRCGRFHNNASGSGWKMVYDGGPVPMPSHELTRCLVCMKKYGPFKPQLGIRPEYSCGVHIS